MKNLKTHCSWCDRIYNPLLDEWEKIPLKPSEPTTGAACERCIETDPRLAAYKEILERRQRAS